MEFRSQSQRLQDEMAEDVERLQDQLTEAEEEVDQVRSNLIVLKRQAYDDKEKYDLSMQTSEEKRRELERKLGASCLEEICLKKALSEAHAESERLKDHLADMNNKYQAAASGEGLLKLAIVDHQRRITVLTRAVEGLKLSHKDEVDRLQLELLRAKGVGMNVPQTRMLGDNDATSVVGDDVARGLPQEPSIPFISDGFGSPTVVSPEARGDQSRGPTHIHSVDARVRDIPAMASPEVRSDQRLKTGEWEQE